MYFHKNCTQSKSGPSRCYTEDGWADKCLTSIYANRTDTQQMKYSVQDTQQMGIARVRRPSEICFRRKLKTWSCFLLNFSRFSLVSPEWWNPAPILSEAWPYPPNQSVLPLQSPGCCPNRSSSSLDSDSFVLRRANTKGPSVKPRF